MAHGLLLLCSNCSQTEDNSAIYNI